MKLSPISYNELLFRIAKHYIMTRTNIMSCNLHWSTIFKWGLCLLDLAIFKGFRIWTQVKNSIYSLKEEVEVSPHFISKVNIMTNAKQSCFTNKSFELFFANWTPFISMKNSACDFKVTLNIVNVNIIISYFEFRKVVSKIYS